MDRADSPNSTDRHFGRPATVDIGAFLALDIRAGVVVAAEAHPAARNPALRLRVDFGPEVGEKGSSAQLSRRYSPHEVVGSVVLGVVNLPPRRVAGFVSEVLILGLVDPEDPGDVVLVRPDPGAGGASGVDVRGWRLA